jgi:SAM-dependent methyltransferase
MIVGQRQNINHWGEPETAPLKELLRARYRYASKYVAGLVLDCACAYGMGSQMLATTDGVERVQGYDIDDMAITTAHVKAVENGVTNVGFACCDFNTMTGLRSCDWVVSCETMEHLLDPAAFAAKIRDAAGVGAVISIPIIPRTPTGRERAKQGLTAHIQDISAEGLDELFHPWKLVHEGRLDERLPNGTIKKELYKLAVYQPAE